MQKRFLVDTIRNLHRRCLAENNVRSKWCTLCVTHRGERTVFCFRLRRGHTDRLHLKLMNGRRQKTCPIKKHPGTAGCDTVTSVSFIFHPDSNRTFGQGKIDRAVCGGDDSACRAQRFFSEVSSESIDCSYSSSHFR
ncbi:hypothetical protein F7725_022010 [Dissostichus mawsoni]|uniref:Uncharacterized protein n=1 Tax=Dissostichus mawsoni TaxID=36200 RepID=A0A7J5ZEP8_DISMA|nr:hypothetical protein F7725_022010 [Dissostichus mawsoni]